MKTLIALTTGLALFGAPVAFAKPTAQAGSTPAMTTTKDAVWHAARVACREQVPGGLKPANAYRACVRNTAEAALRSTTVAATTTPKAERASD